MGSGLVYWGFLALAILRAAPEMQEARLGSSPDFSIGIETYKPVASRDGLHIAYAVKEGAKEFVVVDGTPQSPYDRIVVRPMFSPNGKHVLYAATGIENKQRFVMVVDGKPGGECDRVDMYDLAFSPDGNHVAYPLRVGQKWRMVIDGQVGPEYDGIAHSLSASGNSQLAVFSPDSKRVAYFATRKEKRFVVLDGQPGPEYDDGEVAVPLLFSPDSKHVAYAALRAIGTGGKTFTIGRDGKESISRTMGEKWRLVVDGKPGPEFEKVVNPIFSADGSHVAYGASKDGGIVSFFAVVDGLPRPEYLGYRTLSVKFSPDGKHHAYAASRAGQEVLVVDGKPGPAYDGIEVPDFPFGPGGACRLRCAAR